MSDATAEPLPIDLRATLAQIDRNRAETLKLQRETEKFVAEQHKLLAEGNRYNRDKWILPLTALLSVGGLIIAGALARLPEILHAIRWGIPQ